MVRSRFFIEFERSLTHSLTRLLTYSLLTHSLLTHSITYSLTHSLTYSGMAMLATYPALVKPHENVLDNRVNRAVRLTSTSGGTRLIQLIISKALCRSIGAGCITLNKKKLQMIKKQCLAKAIPKKMLRTGTHCHSPTYSLT